MTDLTTRTLVRCPLSEATARLGRYFSRHGQTDGDRVSLSLEVDLPRPPVARRTEPSDVVVITVRPIGAGHRDPWRYDVQLSIVDRPDFSTFAGYLAVEPPDMDYNAFYLRLTGNYVAPSGSEKRGVNAATAGAIAKELTATMLLSIAADIEYEFKLDERAKLAHGANTGPR